MHIKDCTWMTGLILLTAFDSLLFCALTSILRSTSKRGETYFFILDNVLDSFTFALVSRTKFKGFSRGMHLPFHSLSWAFFTASSISSSMSMTRRRPAKTGCAWSSTRPAWIRCPSSPRPLSRWCRSVRLHSIWWTLSTSPATSICTCFSRTREGRIQVGVL